MGNIGKEPVLRFVQLFQFFYSRFQIFRAAAHQQFQMLLVLSQLGSHEPDQGNEKYKAEDADKQGQLPVIFHDAGELVLLETEADVPNQISGIIFERIVNKQVGDVFQVHLTGVSAVRRLAAGNGSGFVANDPALVFSFCGFGGNMDSVHRQDQKAVSGFGTDVSGKVIIAVADADQQHGSNDLSGIPGL